MEQSQAIKDLDQALTTEIFSMRAKWCPISRKMCTPGICAAFHRGDVISAGDEYFVRPPGCRNPLITGTIDAI